MVCRHDRVWTAAAWIGFAAATALATKPAWGSLVFGFNPTLSDLLSMRCLSGF